MIVSSTSDVKKEENHTVPHQTEHSKSCKFEKTPLCTLIVSFSDSESKKITTSHVFSTTTPQLYPQTRKTVYQNGSQMSLTSNTESSDDGGYRGYTKSSSSPHVPKQLVQEISLSYSSPYTSTVKPSRNYAISNAPPYFLESEYEKNDDLHSHTFISDSRLSEYSNSAKQSDSVEKLLNSGRIETEFPATKPTAEAVPYFSAYSAIKSGRVAPTHTPPATPSFFQNNIVSESSTFEELTYITTTNNRATKKKEPKPDMPTVSALTKQFEASSQKERLVPLSSRSASRNENNQRSKSKSRVVVIDKTEKYSSNVASRPIIVYQPEGILTTTIVDIEPARFRRTEEHKIKESYISNRYEDSFVSPKNQKTSETIHEQVRVFTPHRSNVAENRENIESPVDSSPIDVVRNVINRFETKTGGASHVYTSEQQLRSVSRIDMNDNNSESLEKIIIHQRRDSLPVERIVPVSTDPDVSRTDQAGVIVTREQLEVQTVKQSVEPVAQTQIPSATDDLPELNKTFLSPLLVPTPSPTIDIAEETPTTDFIQESVTTQQTIAKRSSLTQGIEEFNKKEETETTDKEPVHVTKQLEEETDAANQKEQKTEDQLENYLENVFSRDLRIKTYEEWSRTTRKRDQSEPPSMTSPINSSSYLSNRSRSTALSRDRDFYQRRQPRAYSEGRGAYVTGGLASGNLVSGMSSAGAICTTQLRDTREREKREIGLLNDRLADYIEKVRFLEAQNQCLSHDIEILRRGYSGGGHVSALFESEISQAKRILEQTLSGRATFERDIAAITSEIEVYKKKWIDSITAVKAHREDHDVDLDRLSKIEAEISLYKRKIYIVEQDVIRIRRENDGVYNEIARIRGLTHSEIALKNERSLSVQDLLQRIKLLQTENSTRIEQELVFIRRDTTAENRDYFRHELQNAIRDIRADYDAVSIRNRNEIEVWYREQIRKINADSGRVTVDLYKEEIVSIRHTLSSVRTRLAELESRNYILEKLITDLGVQQTEDAKIYEISLAEKDAAIARLREQCTELQLQMEKLCDIETSLRAEIERYRVLLNGANVTTYTSSAPAIGSYHTAHSTTGLIGGTRVVSQTTRTHSSSNTSYSNLSARQSGITVGGNIGGISVGGTIGASSASAHVSGVGSGKRPDRIHDEKGVDQFGRNFHSWYLGTISINQVTPDFIELKNICKIRRVDVGGFRIEQSVNGNILGSAVINVPLILDPQEVLRINTAQGKHLGQFFMNVESFDNSTAARTSLYNYTEPHEERAWFVYLD